MQPADISDPQKTISLTSDKAVFRTLPWSVGLSLLGVIMVVYPRRNSDVWGWLTIAVGIGWMFFVLGRITQPGKPVVQMSPDGLTLRGPRGRAILVPWSEIRAITAVDYSYLPQRSPFKRTLRDVTVLTLTPGLHREHFESFAIPDRPEWGSFFVPRFAEAQLAFNHQFLAVPPRELRAALMHRWHAFRSPDLRSTPAATESETETRPPYASNFPLR